MYLGRTPSRAVLDSFKVAIAKRVADALPPLTVEQVYQGVDYGKKGVDFTIAIPRFRLPGRCASKDGHRSGMWQNTLHVYS